MIKSFARFWHWPGAFPVRTALVLPFLLLPVGVALMLTGVLGGPVLEDVVSVGFLLLWSGVFAAVPATAYILFVGLVVRPRTDRQMPAASLVAPPVCGAISEITGFVATGTLVPPAEYTFFFFWNALLIGYATIAVPVVIYVARLRSPRSAEPARGHTPAA